MSPRTRPWRRPPTRCLATGKVAHRTEGAAWAFAYWAWQRRGAALRAYRCPWCGCWHTTKLNRRETW